MPGVKAILAKGTLCLVFWAGHPAHAKDIMSLWDGYMKTCAPIVLNAAEVARSTDYASLPAQSYAVTEDRRMIGYTVGTPENYTIIYFFEVGGKIGSTCSASIQSTLAAQDVAAFLAQLPDTDVAGGEMPVIIPQGSGGYERYGGQFTWLVENPGWREAGADMHVQHDGYSVITITSFGQEK